MRYLVIALLIPISAEASCTYCERKSDGKQEFHCLDDRYKDPCKKGWRPAYKASGWADKTTKKTTKEK